MSSSDLVHCHLKFRLHQREPFESEGDQNDTMIFCNATDRETSLESIESRIEGWLSLQLQVVWAFIRDND